MIVIGAGMAGLLAAAMLRSECTQVVEKQRSLPNNHSAVLRFRSSIVADTLNIPFQPVDVLKSIHPWRNPVADAMAYSLKTNGTSTLRSIVSANGMIERRYIAPQNLIGRMASCVSSPISFDISFGKDDLRALDEPIISTIPMPALMGILGWRDVPEFNFRDGTNIAVSLDDVNAYCSLYIPDPGYKFSRISITGSEMVIECGGTQEAGTALLRLGDTNSIVREAGYLCGIHPRRIGDPITTKQPYSKILPIDDHVRKRFMLWATEKHNVYSLGRFATWRPGLLLDDVVNDVRTIHRMVHGGTTYEGRKS
tara:strand:- start:97 stop:1026 length:930 start_codon:yes stop_codon:yes gene_type:complete